MSYEDRYEDESGVFRFFNSKSAWKKMKKAHEDGERGRAAVNTRLAVVKTLTNNFDEYSRYKDGEDKLFGFFVGQVMKEFPQANPALVNKMLQEELSK